MATKAEQAVELFKLNPNLTVAELTQLIQDKLSMTPLGARTYAYNARKATGAYQPKVRVKAEKAEKAEKAPKVEKGRSKAFKSVNTFDVSVHTVNPDWIVRTFADGTKQVINTARR